MEVLVDRTRASEPARERAKVMLRTLTREFSVRDGCEHLGVGRTRFQDLRRRMLEQATLALEDGVAGRPRSARRGAPRAERRLQHRVRELEHELLVVRTELDIARSDVGEAVRARLVAKGRRRWQSVRKTRSRAPGGAGF